MSVRVRHGKPMEDIPSGTICCYCGYPITAIAVYWMGASDTDIWLHDQCVMELMLRLSRDVWEIECRTHRYVTRMEWRAGGPP